MWKAKHHAAADRRGLGYPRDLTDADYALWLDVGFGTLEAVQELLRPAAIALDPRPVSRHVNNPRHDDPGCLEPADAI
jgi:putative SOS response-associated peptidase YedK